MIYHAKDFDFDNGGRFDVAVVGAGAVGLPLAVKMAKAGQKVVVLEAGSEVPSQASQAYFEEARIAGHDLPGLHIGRFRNLGGTTAFWGGQMVPFAPIVFEKRPWISAHSWPIEAKDITAYYREAFDITGMSSVITDDAEVWKQLGLTPPPATDRIQPIFTRWTPEPNFAILFRDELRSLPNLTVILDAQVGAFSVGAEGKVDAVELRLRNNTRPHLRASEVVLACGTVEISRLLLLPGAEGKPTPWADNSWIGRAFIDHVDCYAGSVEPVDRRRFSDLFDNAFINGIKYNPKLRLADNVQREEQLLEISSHFVFNSSFSENIANLKIMIKGLLKGRVERSAFSNPLVLLGTLRFIVPMGLRYLRYRRMLNLADAGIQLRLTSEQRPLVESRILLDPESDAFGLPKVAVDWRINPDDIESIARFGEFVRDYLAEQNIAQVTLDPSLVARDPAFLDKTDDANHQMGGARMADGPDAGVVDKNCKVFGVSNLHVAGAAVYPVSGFANPTFTAIAFGLRLADHLLNRVRERDAATA